MTPEFGWSNPPFLASVKTKAKNTWGEIHTFGCSSWMIFVLIFVLSYFFQNQQMWLLNLQVMADHLLSPEQMAKAEPPLMAGPLTKSELQQWIQKNRYKESLMQGVTGQPTTFWFLVLCVFSGSKLGRLDVWLFFHLVCYVKMLFGTSLLKEFIFQGPDIQHLIIPARWGASRRTLWPSKSVRHRPTPNCWALQRSEKGKRWEPWLFGRW